ncbi:DUF4781 domain-containing protein, partial [Pseudonocardia sp. GCM10023141]|uniref:preprotein translocase subunit SecA n=1 Tax=Pseudonocardia sp. GCM10023141 TaxID=3252653 RepID=UPI00361683D0
MTDKVSNKAGTKAGDKTSAARITDSVTEAVRNAAGGKDVDADALEKVIRDAVADRTGAASAVTQGDRRSAAQAAAKVPAAVRGTVEKLVRTATAALPAEVRQQADRAVAGALDKAPKPATGTAGTAKVATGKAAAAKPAVATTSPKDVARLVAALPAPVRQAAQKLAKNAGSASQELLRTVSDCRGADCAADVERLAKKAAPELQKVLSSKSAPKAAVDLAVALLGGVKATGTAAGTTAPKGTAAATRPGTGRTTASRGPPRDGSLIAGSITDDPRYAGYRYGGYGDDPAGTEKLLTDRIASDKGAKDLAAEKKQVAAGKVTEADYAKHEAAQKKREQQLATDRQAVDPQRAELVDQVVDGQAALDKTQAALDAEKKQVAAGKVTAAAHQKNVAKYEDQKADVYAATDELRQATDRSAPNTVSQDGPHGDGSVAGCGSSGVFVECGSVSATKSGEQSDRCVALAGVSSGCGVETGSGDTKGSASCVLTGADRGCTSTTSKGDITANASCTLGTGAGDCGQNSQATTNGAGMACATDSGGCKGATSGPVAPGSADKTSTTVSCTGRCSVDGVSDRAGADAGCRTADGVCDAASTGASRNTPPPAAKQAANRTPAADDQQAPDNQQATGSGTGHCQATTGGCDLSTSVRLDEGRQAVADAQARCGDGATGCSGAATTKSGATSTTVPATAAKAATKTATADKAPAAPARTTDGAADCTVAAGGCRAHSGSAAGEGGDEGRSDTTVQVDCGSQQGCTGKGDAATKANATGVAADTARAGSGTATCAVTAGGCDAASSTVAENPVTAQQAARRSFFDTTPVSAPAAPTDGAGGARSTTSAHVDCGDTAGCTGTATTATTGKVTAPAAKAGDAAAVRETKADTRCTATAGGCSSESTSEVGDSQKAAEQVAYAADGTAKPAVAAGRDLTAASTAAAAVDCASATCTGSGSGTTSGSASGDITGVRDSTATSDCTAHGTGASCRAGTTTNVADRAASTTVDPVTGVKAVSGPASVSEATASVQCTGGTTACGGSTTTATSARDTAVSPAARGTSSASDCTVTGGGCQGASSSKASSAADYIVIDPTTGKPAAGQPTSGPTSMSSSSASVDCAAGAACSGTVHTSTTAFDGAVDGGRPRTSEGTASCAGGTGGCQVQSVSNASTGPGSALAMAGPEQKTNVARLGTGPSAASASGAALTCEGQSACSGKVTSAATATDPSVSPDPRGSHSEGSCEGVSGGGCQAVTNSGASSGPDANSIAPLVQARSTQNATVTSGTTGDQPQEPADQGKKAPGPDQPATPPAPTAPGSSANSGGPTVAGASSWTMANATLDCAGDAAGCTGTARTTAAGNDGPTSTNGANGARGPPGQGTSTTSGSCSGTSACHVQTGSTAGSGQVVADMVAEQQNTNATQLAEQAAQAKQDADQAAQIAARTGATAQEKKQATDAAAAAKAAGTAATDAAALARKPVTDAPATMTQSSAAAQCAGAGCRAATTGDTAGAPGAAHTTAACTSTAAGCGVASTATTATVRNAGQTQDKDPKPIPGFSGSAQASSRADCPEAGCTATLTGSADVTAGPRGELSHSTAKGDTRCARTTACQAQISAGTTSAITAPGTDKAARFATTSASVAATCTDGSTAGCATRASSQTEATGAAKVTATATAACATAGACQAGTGGYAGPDVAEVTAGCTGTACTTHTEGTASAAGVGGNGTNTATSRTDCTAGADGQCAGSGRVGASKDGTQVTAACAGTDGSTCTHSFSAKSEMASTTGGNTATASASCGAAGAAGSGWCGTNAVADTTADGAMASAACQGSAGSGCHYAYRAHSSASAPGASATATGHGEGAIGGGWAATSAMAAGGNGSAQAGASCAGSEGSSCSYSYRAESHASAPGARADAVGHGGGTFGGGNVATSASASGGPGYAAASASCTGSAGTSCSHSYSASASASASDPATGSWAHAAAHGSGGGGMGGGGVSVSAQAFAKGNQAYAGASCSGAANCSASYTAHAEADDVGANSAPTMNAPGGYYRAHGEGTCSGSGNGGCGVIAYAVAKDPRDGGGAGARCYTGNCANFNQDGTSFGFVRTAASLHDQYVAAGIMTPDGKWIDQKLGEHQVGAEGNCDKGTCTFSLRDPTDKAPVAQAPCAAPCKIDGKNGQTIAADKNGKVTITVPTEGADGKPSKDVVVDPKGGGSYRDDKGHGRGWVDSSGTITDGYSGSTVTYADTSGPFGRVNPPSDTGPHHANYGDASGGRFSTTCPDGCSGSLSNGKQTDQFKIYGSPGTPADATLVARNNQGTPAMVSFNGAGWFKSAEGVEVKANGDGLPGQPTFGTLNLNPQKPAPGQTAGRTELTTPGIDTAGTMQQGRYSVSGQTGYIAFPDGRKIENQLLLLGYDKDVASNRLVAVTPTAEGKGGSFSCVGHCVETVPGNAKVNLANCKEVCTNGLPGAYNQLDPTKNQCNGRCEMTDVFAGNPGSKTPNGYFAAHMLTDGSVTSITPQGDAQQCTGKDCSFTQGYRDADGNGGFAVCHPGSAGGTCSGENREGDTRGGNGVATVLLYRNADGSNRGGACGPGGAGSCVTNDAAHTTKWRGDVDASWMLLIDPTYQRPSLGTDTDKKIAANLPGYQEGDSLPPLTPRQYAALSPDDKQRYDRSLPTLTQVDKDFATARAANAEADLQFDNVRSNGDRQKLLDAVDKVDAASKDGGLSDRDKAALKPELDLIAAQQARARRMDVNRGIVNGLDQMAGGSPLVDAKNQGVGLEPGLPGKLGASDLPGARTKLQTDLGVDKDGSAVDAYGNKVKLTADQQSSADAAEVLSLSVVGRKNAMLAPNEALDRDIASFEAKKKAGTATRADLDALKAEAKPLDDGNKAIKAINENVVALTRDLPGAPKAGSEVLRKDDAAFLAYANDPKMAQQAKDWNDFQTRVDAVAGRLANSSNPNDKEVATQLGTLSVLGELNYQTVTRDIGSRSPDNRLGELALPSSGRADMVRVLNSAINKPAYDHVTDDLQKKFFDQGGLEGDVPNGKTAADRRADFASRGTPDEMVRARLGGQPLTPEDVSKLDGKIKDRIGDGKATQFIVMFEDPKTHEAAGTPIYRVEKDGKTTYVDQNGDYYSDRNDFKNHNELFNEDTRILTPSDWSDTTGDFALDRDNGRHISGWDKAKGWVAAGAMVVGGIAIAVGTAGTGTAATVALIAGATVVVGTAAYTTVDAVQTLNARSDHGQSTSFSDPAARAAYITIGGNILTVATLGLGGIASGAAKGATTAAEAGNVASAASRTVVAARFATAGRVANWGAVGTFGGGMVDSGVQLWQHRNEMSAGEKWAAGGMLALNVAMLGQGRIQGVALKRFPGMCPGGCKTVGSAGATTRPMSEPATAPGATPRPGGLPEAPMTPQLPEVTGATRGLGGLGGKPASGELGTGPRTGAEPVAGEGRAAAGPPRPDAPDAVAPQRPQTSAERAAQNREVAAQRAAAARQGQTDQLAETQARGQERVTAAERQAADNREVAGQRANDAATASGDRAAAARQGQADQLAETQARGQERVTAAELPAEGNRQAAGERATEAETAAAARAAAARDGRTDRLAQNQDRATQDRAGQERVAEADEPAVVTDPQAGNRIADAGEQRAVENRTAAGDRATDARTGAEQRATEARTAAEQRATEARTGAARSGIVAAPGEGGAGAGTRPGAAIPEAAPQAGGRQLGQVVPVDPTSPITENGTGVPPATGSGRDVAPAPRPAAVRPAAPDVGQPRPGTEPVRSGPMTAARPNAQQAGAETGTPTGTPDTGRPGAPGTGNGGRDGASRNTARGAEPETGGQPQGPDAPPAPETPQPPADPPVPGSPGHEAPPVESYGSGRATGSSEPHGGGGEPGAGDPPGGAARGAGTVEPTSDGHAVATEPMSGAGSRGPPPVESTPTTSAPGELAGGVGHDGTSHPRNPNAEETRPGTGTGRGTDTPAPTGRPETGQTGQTRTDEGIRVHEEGKRAREDAQAALEAERAGTRPQPRTEPADDAVRLDGKADEARYAETGRVYRKDLKAMRKSASGGEIRDTALARKIRKALRGADPYPKVIGLISRAAESHPELLAGRTVWDGQLVMALALARDEAVVQNLTGQGKEIGEVLAVVARMVVKGDHVKWITLDEGAGSSAVRSVRPLLDRLGLRVELNTPELSAKTKATVDEADLVVSTLDEFRFDTMRGTTGEQKAPRDADFWLLDEVDYALFDQARSHGRLARPAPDTAPPLAELRSATGIAEQLTPPSDGRPNGHFEHAGGTTWRITDAGVEHIRTTYGIDLAAEAHTGLRQWVDAVLTANHGLERGVHYLVENGFGPDGRPLPSIRIVDQPRGLARPQQRWDLGVMEAVEFRELGEAGVGTPSLTIASMSTPEFMKGKTFAGATGTVGGAEGVRALRELYGKDVVFIAPETAVKRVDETVDLPTIAAEHQRSLHDVEQAHAAGLPVVVGARSVREAHEYSAELTRRGISHQLMTTEGQLLGLRDHVVATAGMPGRVTVTTNMLARSVDIKLGGDPTWLAERVLMRLEYPGLRKGDPEYDAALRAVTKQARTETAQYKALLDTEGGGLQAFWLGASDLRTEFQWRGRTGRGGENGVSRLYRSLEDAGAPRAAGTDYVVEARSTAELPNRGPVALTGADAEAARLLFAATQDSAIPTGSAAEAARSTPGAVALTEAETAALPTMARNELDVDLPSLYAARDGRDVAWLTPVQNQELQAIAEYRVEGELTDPDVRAAAELVAELIPAGRVRARSFTPADVLAIQEQSTRAAEAFHRTSELAQRLGVDPAELATVLDVADAMDQGRTPSAATVPDEPVQSEQPRLAGLDDAELAALVAYGQGYATQQIAAILGTDGPAVDRMLSLDTDHPGTVITALLDAGAGRALRTEQAAREALLASTDLTEPGAWERVRAGLDAIEAGLHPAERARLWNGTNRIEVLVARLAPELRDRVYLRLATAGITSITQLATSTVETLRGAGHTRKDLAAVRTALGAVDAPTRTGPVRGDRDLRAALAANPRWGHRELAGALALAAGRPVPAAGEPVTAELLDELRVANGLHRLTVLLGDVDLPLSPAANFAAVLAAHAGVGPAAIPAAPTARTTALLLLDALVWSRHGDAPHAPAATRRDADRTAGPSRGRTVAATGVALTTAAVVAGGLGLAGAPIGAAALVAAGLVAALSTVAHRPARSANQARAPPAGRLLLLAGAVLAFGFGLPTAMVGATGALLGMATSGLATRPGTTLPRMTLPRMTLPRMTLPRMTLPRAVLRAVAVVTVVAALVLGLAPAAFATGATAAIDHTGTAATTAAVAALPTTTDLLLQVAGGVGIIAGAAVAVVALRGLGRVVGRVLGRWSGRLRTGVAGAVAMVGGGLWAAVADGGVPALAVGGTGLVVAGAAAAAKRLWTPAQPRAPTSRFQRAVIGAAFLLGARGLVFTRPLTALARLAGWLHGRPIRTALAKPVAALTRLPAAVRGIGLGWWPVRVDYEVRLYTPVLQVVLFVVLQAIGGPVLATLVTTYVSLFPHGKLTWRRNRNPDRLVEWAGAFAATVNLASAPSVPLWTTPYGQLSFRASADLLLGQVVESVGTFREITDPSQWPLGVLPVARANVEFTTHFGLRFAVFAQKYALGGKQAVTGLTSPKVVGLHPVRRVLNWLRAHDRALSTVSILRFFTVWQLGFGIGLAGQPWNAFEVRLSLKGLVLRWKRTDHPVNLIEGPSLWLRKWVPALGRLVGRALPAPVLRPLRAVGAWWRARGDRARIEHLTRAIGGLLAERVRQEDTLASIRATLAGPRRTPGGRLRALLNPITGSRTRKRIAALERRWERLIAARIVNRQRIRALKAEIASIGSGGSGGPLGYLSGKDADLLGRATTQLARATAAQPRTQQPVRNRGPPPVRLLLTPRDELIGALVDLGVRRKRAARIADRFVAYAAVIDGVDVILMVDARHAELSALGRGLLADVLAHERDFHLTGARAHTDTEHAAHAAELLTRIEAARTAARGALVPARSPQRGRIARELVDRARVAWTETWSGFALARAWAAGEVPGTVVAQPDVAVTVAPGPVRIWLRARWYGLPFPVHYGVAVLRAVPGRVAGIAKALWTGSASALKTRVRVKVEHRIYPTYVQALIAEIPIIGPVVAEFVTQLLHLKLRGELTKALKRLFGRGEARSATAGPPGAARSVWQRIRDAVTLAAGMSYNRAFTGGVPPVKETAGIAFPMLPVHGHTVRVRLKFTGASYGPLTNLDAATLAQKTQTTNWMWGLFLLGRFDVFVTIDETVRLNFFLIYFVVVGKKVAPLASSPKLVGFHPVRRLVNRLLALDRAVLHWSWQDWIQQLQAGSGIGLPDEVSPNIGEHRVSVQALEVSPAGGPTTTTNMVKGPPGRVLHRVAGFVVRTVARVVPGPLRRMLGALAARIAANGAGSERRAKLRMLRRFDAQMQRERAEILELTGELTGLRGWLATLRTGGADAALQHTGMATFGGASIGPVAIVRGRIARVEKRLAALIGANRDNHQRRQAIIESTLGGAAAPALPPAAAPGITVRGDGALATGTAQGRGPRNNDAVDGVVFPQRVVAMVADQVGTPVGARPASEIAVEAGIGALTGIPDTATGAEVAQALFAAADAATAPAPDALVADATSALAAVVTQSTAAGGGLVSRADLIGLGDSQALLVRADGTVEQITTDDTLAATRTAEGRAPAAPTSVSTRWLGSGHTLHAGTWTVEASGPALLILVTDGVSDLFPTPESLGAVIDFTAGLRHPAVVVRQLLDAARELGGTDDTTVAVIPLNTRRMAPPAGPQAGTPTRALPAKPAPAKKQRGGKRRARAAGAHPDAGTATGGTAPVATLETVPAGAPAAAASSTETGPAAPVRSVPVVRARGPP